jgi:hypothetical protein
VSGSADEPDLDGLSDDELVAYYAQEMKRAEAEGAVRPRSRGLVFAGALVAALVIVAVVIVIVLGGATRGPGADPNREVEPSAAPSDDATPEIIVPSVESLEIPAGQSPEATAEAISNLFSNWGMAGANRETYEAQFSGDNVYLSLDEYVDAVVDANSVAFGQAIYGENYVRPEFQESIAGREQYNRSVLRVHYQTYGPQNNETYFQYYVFQSATFINNPDGTVTYSVTGVSDDNGGSDTNIVVGSTDGHVSIIEFTVHTVDGRIKLTQPPVFR